MYILTSKYFPLDYWPDLYFPALPDVAVDIQYTEVMEFAVCIATSAEFDVIMPNDVEAVAGTVVVSGAGTTAANGTYTYADAFGKPSYTKGSDYFIAFDDFNGYWRIYLSGVATYYYSTELNVATPDLVTTWTVSGDGIAPVPTVTSTNPLSGIEEIAAFTLEMPMIIDFELYEELSA